MALSTLTSKGQLTLPKPIRDYLGVDTGDQVEFIINDTGEVILTSKTIAIEDIYGMIKKKKGVTIEDMNLAISTTMKKKRNDNEGN